MVAANAITSDGNYIYASDLAGMQEPGQAATPGYPSGPAPLPHGSPYGAPVGVPGTGRTHVNGMDLDDAADRKRELPVNRESDSTGEALSAGPTIREDLNGERRILPSSTENVNMSTDQQDASSGGFTAVNQ